jgi:hypothetical protein
VKIRDAIKRYPFKERLPPALALIIFGGWELHRSGPITRVQVLLVAVLLAASLTSRKTRFFWFMMGIGLGIVLTVILPHWRFW